MWPFRKKVVIRLHLDPEVSPERLARAVEMAGRGRTDTAAWHRDPLDPPDSWRLDPIAREEPTMPDQTTEHRQPLDVVGEPTEDLVSPYGPPDPLTDSGVHQTASIPLNDPCPHCFGTGKVMTTNDLLRQSLTLLGDDPVGHQTVVAEFYARLLRAAPGLVPLFPDDLTDPFSTGEGKDQRDRLLGALLDVGKLYDPDRPDSDHMQLLGAKIKTWGRAHAAFQRPDGTVRPASLKEYSAVFDILMGTLHDATGADWVPVFDEVWEQAYDHTARGMIAAAWDSGFTSARYPRA
jgi:hemoglobin-like flavoprotein